MFDWIGRTLLLVLSGLATFAILASLESASRGNGTLRDPVTQTSAANPQTPAGEPVQTQVQDNDRAAVPAAQEPMQNITGPVALPTPAPAPVQDAGVAKLLEALTYAVLALAGFAAAILIVLLRITAHLARIAERS